MTIIDMHIHLKLRSRCSNLSAEDLYNNLSQCFDAICITDHWKLEPKKYNPFHDIKVFYGVELDCSLGDILAYGIKSLPLKRLSAEKAIKYIHNQGGIAVCAHPYSNRHEGFGDYVYDYAFDAIEINGALNKKLQRMAEEVAIKMDLPTIGGSDAHSIKQLNTIGTKFEIPINSISDIIKAVKSKKCKAIKIWN
ncbi:MAG: PHP-associated domain-containing protein [Promethearchaeota archaeon]